MSKFTDWILGERPRPLELKELSVATRSRTTMPKAPVLDSSLFSLGNYARKSELVYACIEKKASAACDPELIIQTKKKDGEWEKLDGHPALEALLNPNPYDDGESFMKSWIASENIAGTFYAEIVKNQAGQPVQLFPLRPDWIWPQYKSTFKGEVLDYYAYRANGYEVRFKPEELLIRRRHGLGSMYGGLSPLVVALLSVDADIAAKEYIRDFFNNDGTPSGILKITGRNLSDDEAARMKQKWQAQYSRGGKNRGGISILDERADYQVVGARLDQLDSESLTSIDETRICMAFGVPPVIIGAYVGLRNVNQKASFKGAMEEFWMNTMSPELKGIRKFLTRKYLPLFVEMETIQREEIRFFWDMSNVEALQEDVDAVHDRISLGYSTGIYTLNEARAKVGLAEVEPGIGDEFFKPQPVGLPGDEEDKPEPKRLAAKPKCLLPLGEPTVRGVFNTLQEAKKNGHDTFDDDILTEKKTVSFNGLELSREPTELEKSIDLKAIFDSYEQGKESLTKVVLSIRRELIVQAAESVRKRDDADIYTLTLAPPKNAYKLVTRVVEQAVDEGQLQITRSAVKHGKAHLSFDTKSVIDDLIRRLVELTISRVINEVQTAATNIFAALGVLGLDRDDIEDRMRVDLLDYSEKPFERIAAQSINSAVNAGRREEMRARADEIRLYEYSAILDKATCEPCEDWDGKQADNLDDLPETPNAECDGGGNCRCFIISIFEGEANS